LTARSSTAVDILFAHAVQAYRAGRMREAEAQLERVIAVDPARYEALHLLGLIAYGDGRQERAVDFLRSALKGDRRSAERHAALGAALLALGELEEAAKSFRRAVTLRPADSMAHSNLGEALRRAERPAEAETSFRRAIGLDASNADAHYNLGVLLYETGREAEAAECFRRALELVPQSADYRTHLAYALLAGGRLEEGWREHEWRFGVGKMAFPREFPQPHWQGEALEGRSLLVWMEQGIADQLMLASLLPELIARSARCMIECAPKLVELFRSSFPRAEVVPRSDPPDERTLAVPDLQVAAGSAARWLRPAPDRFPAGGNYLRPDPARALYWRQRLAALGPGLKAGFSWRSSDLSGARALACTRLDQWGPIMAIPGVHFVCLQYDECAAELERARKTFNVALHAFPEVDLFNDLNEAAALTQAVDVVITAPTAVSTLAAGLGVDTWQMSYGVDWKTLGTGRTPWHPTLTRFDRVPGQPWEEIIRVVAAKLGERASTK
jgi:Tfp pilus assembly protein PilF